MVVAVDMPMSVARPGVASLGVASLGVGVMVTMRVDAMMAGGFNVSMTVGTDIVATAYRAHESTSTEGPDGLPPAALKGDPI